MTKASSRTTPISSTSNAAGPVPVPAADVTLAGLALCFLHIALASFGGGLSAWTRRIVVEQRRWLTDEEFLNALTIARLFPGPNQVNMAIFVGERFRGLPGALAALAGLLLVPVSILLTMGYLYFRYHTTPALQSVLTGVVAAAAGMAVSMGVKLIGNYLNQADALLFAAAAFLGVSYFHFSLPLVVLVLAPISMVWYWPRGGSNHALPRRDTHD